VLACSGRARGRWQGATIRSEQEGAGLLQKCVLNDEGWSWPCARPSKSRGESVSAAKFTNRLAKTDVPNRQKQNIPSLRDKRKWSGYYPNRVHSNFTFGILNFVMISILPKKYEFDRLKVEIGTEQNGLYPVCFHP
jgi:hypothetical protein